MNFYNLIFIIYNFIPYASPEANTNYLTKNSTKQWYKNFTRRISPTNPYCLICCIDITKRILAKTCGKHTMCIYQNRIYGPGCKGFLDIPFVEDEIDVIVDAHNTLRNKVAMGLEQKGNPGPQPTASNMRVLEWNADLAITAHRWASQCIFGHDVCRDTPKYPVGQNVAKGNFATNNDLSFIVNWFDFVQYISVDDITSFELSMNDPLRQYTQLVWADTYQIGCARVVFQKTVGIGNTSYNEHFICNYGPTGNIRGQPVYKIGEPCSYCPEGTGCAINYQGLCGTEIDFVHIKNLHSRPLRKRMKVHISFCEKMVPIRSFHYIIFFLFVSIIFY